MTAAAFGHPGCLLVFSFISPCNEDSVAGKLLAQGRGVEESRDEEGAIEEDEMMAGREERQT